jgi:hypothetical protein
MAQAVGRMRLSTSLGGERQQATVLREDTVAARAALANARSEAAQETQEQVAALRQQLERLWIRWLEDPLATGVVDAAIAGPSQGGIGNGTRPVTHVR